MAGHCLRGRGEQAPFRPAERTIPCEKERRQLTLRPEALNAGLKRAG